MAHTLNTGAPTLIPERPLWRRMLPDPVRSLGRPLIRAWQRYHGQSRGRRRVHHIEQLNAAERARILSNATPIFEDINGFRFVLYPYDAPNLLNLVKHPADVAEFEAIPRLVRCGDIAFDVGANIGLYSVLLSRLCGHYGRVWAFEPVPETCSRLRETIALNRCDNVVPVRAAVSDTDGTLTMNLFDAQFSELNSLGSPHFTMPDGSSVAPRNSAEVAACTLDRFCTEQKIARINFLKVDVEGFELAVFQGGQGILQEHRVDHICFEISKAPLRGAGLESRQVFEALEAYGYLSYSLDRETGKFEGPVTDTAEDWTNFFASTVDLRKL